MVWLWLLHFRKVRRWSGCCCLSVYSRNRWIRWFLDPPYSWMHGWDLLDRQPLGNKRCCCSFSGLSLRTSLLLAIHLSPKSIGERRSGCRCLYWYLWWPAAKTHTYILLQWRSELLGLLLCGACVAAPSIEKRLEELQPGRGRRAAAAMQGTQQGFIYDSAMDLQTKQVCCLCTNLFQSQCQMHLKRWAIDPYCVNLGTRMGINQLA